jgi:hypothetical protein
LLYRKDEQGGGTLRRETRRSSPQVFGRKEIMIKQFTTIALIGLACGCSEQNGSSTPQDRKPDSSISSQSTTGANTSAETVHLGQVTTDPAGKTKFNIKVDLPETKDASGKQ